MLGVALLGGELEGNHRFRSKFKTLFIKAASQPHPEDSFGRILNTKLSWRATFQFNIMADQLLDQLREVAEGQIVSIIHPGYTEYI